MTGGETLLLEGEDWVGNELVAVSWVKRASPPNVRTLGIWLGGHCAPLEPSAVSRARPLLRKWFGSSPTTGIAPS